MTAVLIYFRIPSPLAARKYRIDDSNPLDVRVIINDSGVENGCGRSISYLEFMEAWNPSGGFMVSAFPGD